MQTPPEPQRVEIDGDTYIRALVTQRNNALDTVAQLEGVIGGLQKENADLKRRLGELQIAGNPLSDEH